MRKKARRELDNKGKKPKKRKKIEKEDQNPPSFISGFFMIFAGSMAFSIFFAMNQPIIGFLAGAGFIIIGMSRISKATAANTGSSGKELLTSD